MRLPDSDFVMGTTSLEVTTLCRFSISFSKRAVPSRSCDTYPHIIIQWLADVRQISHVGQLPQKRCFSDMGQCLETIQILGGRTCFERACTTITVGENYYYKKKQN